MLGMTLRIPHARAKHLESHKGQDLPEVRPSAGLWLFPTRYSWAVDHRSFSLGEALEKMLERELLQQSCDLWEQELRGCFVGRVITTELRHNPLCPAVLRGHPKVLFPESTMLG